MAGKHGRNAPPEKGPSKPLRTSAGDIDAQVLRDVAGIQQSGRTSRFIAGAVSAPVCIAATALPAWLLAGTTTNVNVTFAFSVGIAASIAGVSGWVWGGWKHKKASGARGRVKDLEGQLQDARRRVKELEGDVKRYREDLDRGRNESTDSRHSCVTTPGVGHHGDTQVGD